jgi:hypothetical protein
MRRRAFDREGEGMTRRLFTLMAVLSLLLCVATCVMWARSYYRADFLYHTTYADMRPTALGILDFAGIVQCEIATDTDIHNTFPSGQGWSQVKSGGWDWGSASADADFFMLRFEGLSMGEIGIRTADAHFLGFARGRVAYPFSFGRHSGGPPPDGVCRFVQFPHWALACLTGILPLRAGWRAYRRRRVSVRGRCSKCGYDLRATPGRCPQCGTVPAPDRVKA